MQVAHLQHPGTQRITPFEWQSRGRWSAPSCLCRAGLRDAHILDLSLAHQLLQQRGRLPESAATADWKSLKAWHPPSTPHMSPPRASFCPRGAARKRKIQALAGNEEAAAPCRGSGAALLLLKMVWGTDMVGAWPANSCDVVPQGATGEGWASWGIWQSRKLRE